MVSVLVSIGRPCSVRVRENPDPRAGPLMPTGFPLVDTYPFCRAGDWT
jgi:hypothetical protein